MLLSDIIRVQNVLKMSVINSTKDISEEDWIRKQTNSESTVNLKVCVSILYKNFKDDWNQKEEENLIDTY